MDDSFDSDAFQKLCEEADAKRANARKPKGWRRPIINIPSRSTPGNHQTGQFWTTGVVTYPSSPPTVWARHS